MFFTAYLLCGLSLVSLVKLKPEGKIVETENHIESYNTQIKILVNPRLA